MKRNGKKYHLKAIMNHRIGILEDTFLQKQ